MHALAPDTAARLADLLLLLHASIAVAVIVLLPLVLIGGRRGWQWVRRRWLRLLHLVAIGVIAAQAWLGELCPLTVWEQALRQRAGQPGYSESFIEHWLARLLYVEAPWWMFVAAYTLFALLVAWAWWRVPPAPRGRRRP
jgi:hypothetical protein